MDNIFDTNDLYPGYDDNLKDYYKDYFDTVFVCFSPFFKIENLNREEISVRRSRVISLEEAQENDEALKGLKPSDKRVIYSNNNPHYPSDKEIIDNAIPVEWEYVMAGSGLPNYQEVNLALRTSIGAITTTAQRKDLQEKLDTFTTENNIFQPTEGRITVLSLKMIYKCLIALNKTELVVTDEFFQDRKTINIAELSCSEFISNAIGYMYYFPTDRSLLFSIEWDSFFFLIGGNQKLLEKIIPEFGFDGFYSGEQTTHFWES